LSQIPSQPPPVVNRAMMIMLRTVLFMINEAS
jgi:hypothetical protein